MPRPRAAGPRIWVRTRGRLLGAVLALLLSAFAGTVPYDRAAAGLPLAVRIAALNVIAPGQLAFDVAIVGLQSGRPETIDAHGAVGTQSIVGPATVLPQAADHFRVVFDLQSGRVLLDGVATADFTPVPPLVDNTVVSLDVAVRQGSEVAVGRRTGMLLLPTVIVPGFLNQIYGPPPRAIREAIVRGFQGTGPAPNLFWFSYASTRLGLEEAGNALAAYVRDVVLPHTYAARLNVVAYSSGALPARWCLVFAPGWRELINKMFLVGPPNEGSVLSYILAWYPIARLARTAAARSMLPSYPFWRATPDASWTVPTGAENLELDRLNAETIPPGPRIYVYYGDQPPAPARAGTPADVTGTLPDASFGYGEGDHVVLAASALGLPINGSPGIPGFRERLTAAVNLGPLSHFALMKTSVPRILAILSAAPDARSGRRVPLLPGAEPTTPFGLWVRADHRGWPMPLW